MTEGEAEYELTRLGLKMYSDTAYDATVPKGRIISQQPSPLVEVEEGVLGVRRRLARAGADLFFVAVRIPDRAADPAAVAVRIPERTGPEQPDPEG